MSELLLVSMLMISAFGLRAVAAIGYYEPVQGNARVMQRIFDPLSGHDDFVRETAVHHALGLHDNVVEYLNDLMPSDGILSMKFKALNGGTLYENMPISEDAAVTIMGKMMRTIQYLHEHQVVHLGLSLQSFMYKTVDHFPAQIVLAKFQYAQIVGDRTLSLGTGKFGNSDVYPALVEETVIDFETLKRMDKLALGDAMMAVLLATQQVDILSTVEISSVAREVVERIPAVNLKAFLIAYLDRDEDCNDWRRRVSQLTDPAPLPQLERPSNEQARLRRCRIRGTAEEISELSDDLNFANMSNI